MAKTSIEWTDAVWNPISGCTKISPGCANCYAERMSKRLAGRYGYPKENPFKVTLQPEKLDEPLKWKKPRTIFVNSMSDLFHQDVPDKFIDNVFDMAGRWAKHHIFLILTKRPQRMMEWARKAYGKNAPYPNIWLGVSVENQATARERIPLLLETPAAVRFISAEPLLGPINLESLWGVCPECGSWEIYEPRGDTRYCDECGADIPMPKVGLDWVIAGCESGPKRRYAVNDWFRSLRDQCVKADVPFFLKQMEIDGKLIKMPELDGQIWDQLPEVKNNG